jgi:O-methyltransferase
MTYRGNGPDSELIEMFAARRVSADSVLSCSLLSGHRLKAMMRAIDACSEVAGDTAEIGCAAGGTTRLIASLNGGRLHWACDTFEGLVDVGEFDDGLRNGHFRKKTSELGAVRERLADLPNVQLIKGYFPQSAPQAMRFARYSLVHVDVDTYRSIHACFDFFAPRMKRGGLIVIDDVIGRGTAGGIKAWHEILAARSGWEVIEENNPHVMVLFTTGEA